MSHELYMNRCMELATLGAGRVSPNPMVGAVIVHGDRIVGEGYHARYGEAHAEVRAMQSISDEVLKDSTLYVSLEPCSHTGKTPPCADLIIEKKIPRVIFAIEDPNPLVSGQGAEKLRKAGIEVISGICAEQALALNRRFITSKKQNRPYIILKWAQSINGKIGKRNERVFLTGMEANRLSHKWRSEEDAILVGAATVIADNPKLTCRSWPGKNPIRVVLKDQRPLEKLFHIYDSESQTLFIDDIAGNPRERMDNILSTLSRQNLLSLIVEGGADTLNLFINTGMWDECRIFSTDVWIQDGVQAPEIPAPASYTENINKDRLIVIKNSGTP